jgi:hypothetical protein
VLRPVGDGGERSVLRRRRPDSDGHDPCRRLARIAPDDPRGFGLTQALTGELANASRPTVVRALAEFRERGWIEVSYGRLRIIAPAALDAFVRASAPCSGYSRLFSPDYHLARTRGRAVLTAPPLGVGEPGR